MSETQNPYAKPITPKNSLELLRWAVMEPTRVKRYESNLEEKGDQIRAFLKVYGIFCVLFILFWLISALCIAYWNVPEAFSNAEVIFEESFLTAWKSQHSVEKHLLVLIMFSYENFVITLAIGLAGGLLLGLTERRGLVGSLAIGLALGLATGMAAGLAYNFLRGFSINFMTSLALGLAAGIELSLLFGTRLEFGLRLAYGLVGGVVLGLVAGWILGWVAGLVAGLAFYISYFRLPLWAVYHFLGFSVVRIDRNLYLKDELVWLPVWGIDQKLQALAKFDFTIFAGVKPRLG